MAELPGDQVGITAWSRLRRFHNPQFVTDMLIALHKLPLNQKSNASKQAAQIRYSLLQAREYYDACKVATLATQPTLLYYSAMHLALAEVLTKQTGESSLDRAREQHRHHGLDFKCTGRWLPGQRLDDVASRLRARPLIKEGGQRFGTFELWHRSAREAPIGGYITQSFQDVGATTTGFRLILGPKDAQLNGIHPDGLSFLDCIASIPGLEQTASEWGVPPQIIRAAINVSVGTTGNRSDCNLIVHPGRQPLLNAFFSNMIFFPAAVDRIDVKQPPSGIIVRWWEDENNFPTFRSIPHGCMAHTKEVKFWPEDRPLNEFGYLYIALFIAGNYARYYPDWWMRDIESSSPLALAIEQLLRVAEEQLPLLTLSELSRTSFVRSAP